MSVQLARGSSAGEDRDRTGKAVVITPADVCRVLPLCQAGISGLQHSFAFVLTTRLLKKRFLIFMISF